MKLRMGTHTHNFAPHLRPASSPQPSQNQPPEPPEDGLDLSTGKILEYGGFATLMIGGSVVVAESVGLLAGGGTAGLVAAALGATAMVGGKYLQNQG